GLPGLHGSDQTGAPQRAGGSEDHRSRLRRQLQHHLQQRTVMTRTQELLGELEREAARTKRALEEVPAGRDDWKPHEKSMALGRLAGMISTMPAWVTFIVKQDELDL